MILFIRNHQSHQPGWISDFAAGKSWKLAGTRMLFTGHVHVEVDFGVALGWMFSRSSFLALPLAKRQRFKLKD